MSYSNLASNFYPAHPNNYQVGRGGRKICKITPHIMAGVLTSRECGVNVFQKPNRIASSNYGIGYDGDIACYVEEENRSYCSYSELNDGQAITIECSNDVVGGEWTISDKTWNSLVNLCVDICKRHNFRLKYDGTPNGSLTRHNMFYNTACPGAYVTRRLSELESTVNALLDGDTPAPTPTPTPSSDRETGALFMCTGLWTSANGGTWYSANELVHGKGVYEIGKVHAGTEHPYEALKNGTVIGFANDKCIDDEPSSPYDNIPTPTPPKPTKKSAQTVVDEIMSGTGGWGNDPIRRQKLIEYNGVAFADEVQAIINGGSYNPAPSMSARQFALEVWIEGKHGKGEERRANANALGVSYDEVQRLIEILANGGNI